MFTVYLRFINEDAASDQWKFSGFFEPFVKYFPSSHQLMTLGHDPFLLVKGQGAAGSGLSFTIEHWFDLGKPGMRPCLSRTISGNWRGLGSLSVNIFSSITAFSEDPVERLSMLYHADFIAGDPDLVMARRQDDVVFIRRTDCTFELDAIQSTATKTEIHELYEDPTSLTPDDFLRLNVGDLRADLGDRQLRDWVIDYLALCGNTPEKRELLGLIRKYRDKAGK